MTYRDGAGVRKRKHFTRKKDAEEFRSDLEKERAEHGVQAISAEDRALLSEFRPRLDALGIDLRTALNEILESHEARPDEVTVPDLSKQFQANKKAEGISHRHQLSMRSVLARFEKAYPGRARDLTPSEINRYLSSMKVSNTTRNNHRRQIGGMFAWGVKMGHHPINPVTNSMRFKAKPGETGILTPGQVETFLKHCNADLRPAAAIGFFAGLRAAEIQRLEWSDIREDHIDLSSGKTKSARRRLVKMPDNLKAFLSPRRKGRVFPWSERAYYERIGEAAEKAAIPEWPHNAMRHSYASYHLAQHRDAAALALELGHTNPRIIFEHYRELVTPEAAAEYWGIAP